MRWKHAVKVLESGIKTFRGLPQTDPTMNRKNLLLNTGKKDSQEINNLMNNKVHWAFVDTENNIQSVHSLVHTADSYVGILGDELDSNQRVLLSSVTNLTSCFVSIGDMDVATTGNQQFLDEPGTKELKAVSGPPVSFMTPALLGMNEGADS